MPTTLTLNQPAEPLQRAQCAGPPLDLARLVHPLDWMNLPSSLRRRFEAAHGPARYCGTLTCTRSMLGACFEVLSRAFGAPLASMRVTHAPVVVTVCAVGAGVVWSRRLGPSHCVRSVKSAGPGGTVLERTDGGLGMVLDLSVEDDALIFTSRGFFIAIGSLRLPIPAVLTPGRCRVEHRAIDDARFRFTLTMVHPFWGTTFRQDGVFTESQEPLS